MAVTDGLAAAPPFDIGRPASPQRERILVVKLGALGDIVLSMGPFAAIRRHHAQAHITLLTGSAYAEFLRASPWFDEVWVDERPSLLGIGRWLELRRRLRQGGFERVYDLQTSDRSGWYFRLMGPGPRPQWSGIVRGCSHPHANPRRNFMHTLERQAEQLAMAGIDHVPPPDLSWAQADVARFDLPPRYALLVPGGAPHRPAKRWPVQHFSALARHLATHRLAPVVLGARSEVPLAQEIGSGCPESRDLTGRTDLADLAALARGASCAVGNDTGPMHMIAAAGCPSVVLFSAASDPALTAPRGPAITVLRRARLVDLPLDAVVAALQPR